MKNWRLFFDGKKITVMGLGLLGRGVGDVKFLAENGARLTVTDKKSEAELASSIQELKNFSNIVYTFGRHEEEDFKDKDYILKAASVPLNSPYIESARASGIPIKMSASWFAELSGVPMIGVTGTRGKSTVTHLIHAILNEAGFETLLGGNVRGVSNLALLNKVTEDSVAVFELDSWQCQGFGEEKISPHVAVFTTLYPDHLNYYKDMDEYLQDKAYIFLNQSENDFLILGRQVADVVQKRYKDKIRAKVIVADPGDYSAGWDIRIVGAHNLLNAVCAIEAARAFGVPDTHIKRALAEFPGVPGRLEFLREVKGVKIYNDTTSTTPVATLAALYALPALRVVLIAGGADKGLDMTELVEALPAYVKKLILLKGTGTEKLVSANPLLFENVPVYDSLSAALEDALRSSQSGDIILFSPGFASLGMFKNEFDRGDQFTSLVGAL
ncbi:UDP-N-acetylmuramoyl-L-alanine--D-glutamate ligase [Patescibacteria group bacterium]|nr:UDP-N-acetylmuramoyl-L-alanine--D-glutamate ligase [Patescibacteria group bacterium]